MYHRISAQNPQATDPNGLPMSARLRRDKNLISVQQSKSGVEGVAEVSFRERDVTEPSAPRGALAGTSRYVLSPSE